MFRRWTAPVAGTCRHISVQQGHSPEWLRRRSSKVRTSPSAWLCHGRCWRHIRDVLIEPENGKSSVNPLPENFTALQMPVLPSVQFELYGSIGLSTHCEYCPALSLIITALVRKRITLLLFFLRNGYDTVGNVHYYTDGVLWPLTALVAGTWYYISAQQDASPE